MEKKQISRLVTAMFAGVGIMGAGAAHAAGCSGANFVDRGNPDNAGAYNSSQPGWAQNGGSANCTGIAIGDGANANKDASGNGTGGSVAVGVNARALNNSAIAIAPSAMAAGNSAVAIGRQSAAVGDYATALGNVADAHGDRSIALGHSAYAVDSQAVAIGSAQGGGNDGVSGGASFDSKTQTRAAGKRAVAIGAGAVTSGDDQLALGSNSIGANNGGTPVFGGTAAPVGGAVSFGSSGKERQLKNVAAGAADTDAVNVQQLKNVNSGLSTSIGNVDARVTNVGNTLSTSITNATNTLNQTIDAKTKNAVKFTDDSHAAIALDGQNGTTISGVAAGVKNTDAANVGQLNTGLSNVTNTVNNQISTLSTSITNQIGSATKNAVQYDGDAHTRVTLGGTNASAPVALANVADGVAKNDAVNVGQLSKATGGLQSQIDTTNNTVTTIGGQVTTNTQNITALQQADTRNVKYDGAQGFDSVTLAGANGTKLTNVKAGALASDSTDAVNGSQLFVTNQNVRQQGDAITSIDGRVTQNTTNIGALQQDALQWSKSAGAYDASHNSGSAQKITNVAAGDVSASSTDAINGAQLKSVQDQINGNIGGATKNAVQYDTDAQGNRTNSVSLAGGASGPVTINNVAAGDLSANSTQAVNGAQLYATNQNVATQTSRVDNLTTNVSSLTSNLSVTNANVSNLQAADKLNVKYDAAGKNSVTLGGAGHAPVALSNIADGVNANDAVNIGQLSKATGGLQSQIDVQGDKITNVDQRVTTNTTNIGRNTTDITALKQDALQWNAGIGAYDASHGTASPQTIANVKAGQADTDAVNVKQLKDSVSSGVNNGATNAVLYDDSSKRQVSLGAGNGGVPVRVKNVAEGGVQAGSLDAVNGSQLRYATDSTAAALGGGASANTNGSINAPKYDIGGTSFNNVGDALGNLDGRVTSNTTTIQNHETRLGNAETNIANNTTIISGLQRDALQFDPAAGAYNAARDGVATKITRVADGNVAAGSTDAVNGGQLFGVKSDLQQQITNVSNQAGEAVKNVVKYDVDANGSRLNSVSLVGGDAASPVVLKNLAAGVDDTDAVNVKQLKAVQSGINQLGAMAVTYDDSSKSIITLGGGSGGTKITNVQAGTLSAASTDAVNGSQLYATNQQVAKNTTDITNLQENVTNVTNGKAGLVQQQDPNGQITVGAGTGGTSVNIANSAGGNRVLTGVGAGVNNNDAVNVGQLNNALRDVSANQAIKAAATDSNTTWITRAEAGSFGSTATATGKNAVAVGQGSVADRDNSFSVGAKGSERQVTNVAAGTAPTDAVNVQQLNDNVAASRSYTDQRVGQVYNDLNTVKKDMFGGVASAMAVAGLPQPTGPGRSMVSAATANYRGQQGFAAGYSYVTQNDKWVVKASVTGNTRSDFGAVVGAGYQF